MQIYVKTASIRSTTQLYRRRKSTDKGMPNVFYLALAMSMFLVSSNYDETFGQAESSTNNSNGSIEATEGTDSGENIGASSLFRVAVYVGIGGAIIGGLIYYWKRKGKSSIS